MTDFRLVYCSENRVPLADQGLRSAMDDILAKSRRNNALVGVSGALMFSAGYFGQILEGRQGALETTFERIQQDARHGEVCVLDFGPVSKRAFEDWSMAYVGDHSQAFDGWIGSSSFDGGIFTANALFEKLRSMVASAAHAA